MTLMLNNYIENDEEWEFPDIEKTFTSNTSNLDNVAPLYDDNMSIQDTIDAHSHLPGEFQLLLDDDFNVYQFVLHEGDDSFEPLDAAMAEYGCTMCFYYDRGNGEWRML